MGTGPRPRRPARRQVLVRPSDKRGRPEPWSGSRPPARPLSRRRRPLSSSLAWPRAMPSSSWSRSLARGSLAVGVARLGFEPEFGRHALGRSGATTDGVGGDMARAGIVGRRHSRSETRSKPTRPVPNPRCQARWWRAGGTATGTGSPPGSQGVRGPAGGVGTADVGGIIGAAARLRRRISPSRDPHRAVPLMATGTEPSRWTSTTVSRRRTPVLAWPSGTIPAGKEEGR